MQFSREEEITAELNMSEFVLPHFLDFDFLTIIVGIREEIAKFDRLEKHYEKPTFEVVSSVFRALSKKKIVSAGTFQRQALLLPLKY
jgi:structure-specific recognition protein 1